MSYWYWERCDEKRIYGDSEKFRLLLESSTSIYYKLAEREEWKSKRSALVSSGIVFMERQGDYLMMKEMNGGGGGGGYDPYQLSTDSPPHRTNDWGTRN